MNESDSPRPPDDVPAAPPPPRRHRDDPGAPFPIEIRLSPRWIWAVIGFFAAVIALPGVLREFSDDSVRGAMAAVFRPGSVPVADRLRAAEKRVDEGVWTAPIRERMQTALYRVFREGNRKALVGRDGWLFHRPGVQALTGRGPVLGPTHSVARDPSLKAWKGPIPVIRDFAAQLHERGIQLVLVPVPDKAALWSHHLAGVGGVPSATRRRHPDWAQFRAALESAVEIVDLNHGLPYLPDDTHWQAVGARAAAAAVAAHLRAAPTETPEPLEEPTLSGQGDLVASLGLTEYATSRWQTSVRIPTTAPVVSDAASSIVLLGDSNVNMFDDASLPFHQPGAGFASWLQACLGEPIHVIAINGGGATQVRERFAALPDDVVHAKKTVVWVLAERDLFMDPSVARAHGVEWQRVDFNPTASAPDTLAAPGEALVIEATLQAKSKLLDMSTVVYRDALFTAEFTVDRVVSGSYAQTELAVVLWNFRNRVVQPTARLAVGQKLRLTLVPFLERDDLLKTPFFDDLQRYDLVLLFAEKAEIVGE